VVDDSPLDGARTADALRTSYEVHLFGDGSSLLEHLATHDPPDVLVLDWVMPGISGPEVCRFIRSSSNLANATIAILLLTGHQHTEQIVEGLSSGANDYLSKPYAEEELKARVGALIRSRELLRRAENAERALRAVLDSAPDALFVLDQGGHVAYANAEAERAFGLDLQSQGRLVSDLVPGLPWNVISQDPAGGKPLADVTVHDDAFSPIVRSFSAGGATEQRTLSLRNVTERRRNEAKRLDFYAIVAHDLRSPLNAMLLRTELILRGKRGPINDVVQNDLKMVQKNAHTLVALINDFLELASLENPTYTVVQEPIDLSPLVTAVLEDLRPLVDAQAHALDVSLPKQPALVLGDRARLHQVLSNLIGNAVKFTPANGRLWVSVVHVDGAVDVRVMDNGPGIDAELIPVLSQRYMRAKGQTVSGTGLGLMIVREILEAHGSALHIESAPGKGSTFWFRLAGAG
jgi:two-component system phosphate regulon sensor histidine kinase PhoR